MSHKKLSQPPTLKDNLFTSSDIGTTKLEPAGREESDPSLVVDIFNITDSANNVKGAAHGTILPNSASPIQLVTRTDPLVDYPIRGSGYLLVFNPQTRENEIYPYKESDDKISRWKYTHTKGAFIQWIADSDGLELVELELNTQFQAGDLEDLKKDDPRIPSSFLQKSKRLASLSKSG